MKSLLFLVSLSFFCGQAHATRFVMPVTHSANSVQATLKNLMIHTLKNTLVCGNETEEEKYGVKLYGDASEVTLVDAYSKVVCREFPDGMLAVQAFSCEVYINDENYESVKSLVLPLTASGYSVQWRLKNILLAALRSDKFGPEHYGAKLSGNPGRITLADDRSSVVCSEQNAGELAVQKFATCQFRTK